MSVLSLDRELWDEVFGAIRGHMHMQEVSLTVAEDV
jgi:hypothetical protein